MPLYEYKCEDCGEEFEVIRRASDDTEELCPSCGKPAERLFSVFSTGGGVGRGGHTCSPGSGGSFGGG